METNSKQPIEQLIANRLAKLDEIRELGQDPYPSRYRVDESVSAAKGRFEHSTAEELEGSRERQEDLKAQIERDAAEAREYFSRSYTPQRR